MNGSRSGHPRYGQHRDAMARGHDPSTRATASGRGLAPRPAPAFRGGHDSAPRASQQEPRALPVGLHGGRLRFLLLGLTAGVVSVGLPAAAGHGAEVEARKPRLTEGLTCKDCNVIMISLSNVSAEHMSLYGYDRVTTPQLDRWAQEAIVFEEAFTPSSWTLPVATSLFTSLYPYTHQVLDRETENVLDETILTLPEILSENGYTTAAFTGGLDYHPALGHMRGFEEAEAVKDTRAAVFAGFEPTLAKASQWLADHAGEKFFLFLHGYDAHCPFDPPAHLQGVFSSTEGRQITVDHELCLRGFRNSDDGTYEAMYFNDGMQTVTLTEDDVTYLEDLYDETVLSVDELVGAFLVNLDTALLAHTVVIVFSDHGEMFARHGRFGRAGAERGTLYDEVVHIPLMMKIPRQPGRRVNGLVQLLDVMPTLLTVLDLPKPGQRQGKDVTPLLTGAQTAMNAYVFAGAPFGGRVGSHAWRMYPARSISESVRSHRWKLIHEIHLEGEQAGEETYELYRLSDDPVELRNLIHEQLVVAAHLKGILESWKRATKRFDVHNTSSPGVFSPEMLEGAKQRGYW